MSTKKTRRTPRGKRSPRPGSSSVVSNREAVRNGSSDRRPYLCAPKRDVPVALLLAGWCSSCGEPWRARGDASCSACGAPDDVSRARLAELEAADRAAREVALAQADAAATVTDADVDALLARLAAGPAWGRVRVSEDELRASQRRRPYGSPATAVRWLGSRGIR